MTIQQINIINLCINFVYTQGDSAGGNLAAALSIKLRNSNEDVQFRYQILLYPLLQGKLYFPVSNKYICLHLRKENSSHCFQLIMMTFCALVH